MFRTIKSWLAPQPEAPAPKTRLAVENLEAREVPAVASVSLSGQDLMIRMDNAGGGAEVRQYGTYLWVSEVGGSRSWTFGTSGVGRLNFYGGAGADRFVNHTSLASSAYGYGGNDTLVGGWGTDYLDGGTNNDHLNGRGGSDSILGSGGDDVLIAIDGGTSDYIDPWTGRDVMWIDRVGSGYDRLSSMVGSDDVVQRVGGFVNTTDRTLNGDRIADPAVKTTDSNGNPTGHYYRSFSGNPLFSSSGPLLQDATQGSLGDCWLIAGISAVANDTPFTLTARVVDFDDGTYGVRLGNNFYRVDSDLPVAPSAPSVPVYARLGAGNSMWAAVLEKAYAHYRNGANSYANLEGGWAVEVNRALGSTSAKSIAIGDYSSAAAMANEIYNRWNNYESVTVGFVDPGFGKYLPGGLINDHMYTVVSVARDSSGVVTSITLRNPWGIDTDRPWGAADGSNDGFVTVAPWQLYSKVGAVNWGKV